MKKITFLMLHMNYGGIERQVTNLANELCKNYNIEIISLYDLLNGKSFYNLDDRINVKYIFNYGPNKREIIQALKKFKIITLVKELVKSIKILYTKFYGIKKIVNNIDSDIVISSRIEFSKQICRKDIITIAQEHSYIDTDKYIKRVKKSFSGIDYLVVMTNRAKEKYDLWLSDVKRKPKIVVIPNVIKENKDGQVSSLNNNQIISIGRLEPVKDFYTLIIVFSILSKKYPSLKLKIVGDGSERSSLFKLVANNSLQDKVFFTGKLSEDEIKDELLKSDVFVLTSKSESFSLVICEAMNYGVPCVAFDVDVGPREILEDGLTGFLIEDRNIDMMIKKISLLLDNFNLRKEMSNNEMISIKKYHLNNIISKWNSLFINI